jgi:hypothetical protein
MRLLTIACTALLFSAPAFATSKIESAYTNTAGKACKVLDSDEQSEWSLFKCPGYKGIDVWIGEGDLRTLVAYGKTGQDEPAFQTTFGPFNTIGDKIEWRLKDGKPFATILRWKVDGGEDLPKGEMLVVTQLKAGQQCWIAVIAAHKNQDANELARQAADELGGTVDCNTSEPELYGTPDTAIYPGQ